VEEEPAKAAREKLAGLPEDRIPEPAVLPAGSHSPEFRSNPRFLGRDAKLKQLAIWLKGNGPNAIGRQLLLPEWAGWGRPNWQRKLSIVMVSTLPVECVGWTSAYQP